MEGVIVMYISYRGGLGHIMRVIVDVLSNNSIFTVIYDTIIIIMYR